MFCNGVKPAQIAGRNPFSHIAPSQNSGQKKVDERACCKADGRIDKPGHGTKDIAPYKSAGLSRNWRKYDLQDLNPNKGQWCPHSAPVAQEYPDLFRIFGQAVPPHADLSGQGCPVYENDQH